MNKNFLSLIVLVVIVAAGYYFFSQPAAAPAPANTPESTVGSTSLESAEAQALIGKWQSTDDAKFIREFKADGLAVDVYEGKDVSSGTWQTFTKEKPLAVSFPLEENTVYIQLIMQGTQSDKLNFKVSKLTETELELIYLDRGGALNFKRVE